MNTRSINFGLSGFKILLSWSIFYTELKYKLWNDLKIFIISNIFTKRISGIFRIIWKCCTCSSQSLPFRNPPTLCGLHYPEEYCRVLDLWNSKICFLFVKFLLCFKASLFQNANFSNNLQTLKSDLTLKNRKKDSYL